VFNSDFYDDEFDLVSRDAYDSDLNLHGRTAEYLDPTEEMVLFGRDIESEYYLTRREGDILDLLRRQHDRSFKRSVGAVLDIRAGSTTSDIGSCSSSMSAKTAWMDGVGTTGTKDMEIAGVNGCTAVFFFGNGKITGGHLAGGEEVAQATVAAGKAKKDKTGATISIMAPDSKTASATKAAVLKVISGAKVSVATYQERPNSKGCWVFRVSQGSTTIKSRYEPGSENSSIPPSPKERSKSPSRGSSRGSSRSSSKG
jgi:hypothetical protein